MGSTDLKFICTIIFSSVLPECKLHDILMFCAVSSSKLNPGYFCKVNIKFNYLDGGMAVCFKFIATKFLEILLKKEKKSSDKVRHI